MQSFKAQLGSTYFIDTNIWLYSFIQTQNKEKNEIARTIIKECEIVITTQIINEICVNNKKGQFFRAKNPKFNKRPIPKVYSI